MERERGKRERGREHDHSSFIFIPFVVERIEQRENDYFLHSHLLLWILSFSFFQTTDQQSVLDHRTTIQTFFLLPKDFIRETINTYDSQDQLHFVTLSFRRVNCSQSFNTLTFFPRSSFFLFLSIIHRLITISEKVESGARIRNLILSRDPFLSQISFKFSSRSSKNIFFSQIHHFSERREIRINRILMTYHSLKNESMSINDWMCNFSSSICVFHSLTLSFLSLSLSFLFLTWHFPNEENFTPPDHDTNLIIASISIFLMTSTKIINWRLWEKVQEKR